MTRQNHPILQDINFKLVHLLCILHQNMNMEKDTLHPAQDERPSQIVEIDRDIVILMHRRPRRLRSFAIAFTAVAFLYLCFSISRPFLFHPGISHFEPQPAVWNQPAETSNSLVPLEAHIMSKCPDAKVTFHVPALCPPCQLIVSDMPEGDGAPNHATSIHQSQFHTIIHRHVSARTPSTADIP
jgi:hypothetical protein